MKITRYGTVEIFLDRGDHKILYPLDWGECKICDLNFVQFFRPPATIVNEGSLRAVYRVLG